MTRHRTGALLLLAAVVLGSLAPTVVGASTVSGVEGVAGRDDTDDTRDVRGLAAVDDADRIRVASELSLTPERPGSVDVRQRFSLPDRLTALTVTLPAGAQVRTSDGFSRVDGRTWEWDGTTTTPALVYAMAANQTAQQSGPMAAEGAYVFADPGPWALVRRPAVGLRWQQQGQEPITADRTASVAGEGAVGGETAFLGPHRVLTHRANGQTFRLVVPAAADLVEPPDRVFDALETASGRLHVGDRDEEVFLVAAPTGRVDWAANGLQVGDRDVWVQADERVGTVQNVWVHEYVHTRQAFTTAPSARWVSEATATWYAAHFALATGDVSFGRFERFLDRGTDWPQSESVLADPATWRNDAQYHKGALVAGDLDRRIRLASDRGASLQTVLQRLNGHSDPVSNADVLAAVAAASDESTRREASRYTESSAAPDTWTREAHQAAFGEAPALMEVVVDPANVRVAGPYREATVGSPVVLVAGETLSVPVRVSNVGGSAGPYAVDLRVNGDVAAVAEGRLDPGASTTTTLAHTFESPGRYTVSVAGEALSVVVREPATPRVTGVSVDRERVAPGETVRVTAEVRNPESVPGSREVTFTRDGEPVATRTVAVGPGESATVTVPVRLNESGTHRLGAGDARVSVSVSESGGFGVSGTEIPGFGVVAAAIAVAVAGLLARRRVE